jgi:hypothetical protein
VLCCGCCPRPCSHDLRAAATSSCGCCAWDQEPHQPLARTLNHPAFNHCRSKFGKGTYTTRDDNAIIAQPTSSRAQHQLGSRLLKPQVLASGVPRAVPKRACYKCKRLSWFWAVKRRFWLAELQWPSFAQKAASWSSHEVFRRVTRCSSRTSNPKFSIIRVRADLPRHID